MPTKQSFFGQSQSHADEEETEDVGLRVCYIILLLIIVGSLIYRVVNGIEGDRPASPERVAEVARQTQATAWDECDVRTSRHTPRTYIDEELKTGGPIKNSTLDVLLEKVEQCNDQRQQKRHDAMHAKAQKAAIN